MTQVSSTRDVPFCRGVLVLETLATLTTEELAMPRLRIKALVVAFAATPCVAHGQVKPEGKAATVQQAIDELWGRVIDADKRGDAGALAANYASDAMVIDPGSPTVAGRANIETLYREVFGKMKLLDVRRTRMSLETSGDLAVETGTATHRVQQGTNPPTQSTERYTIVFKNVKGRWLVSRDVTTPMPEPGK